MTPSDKLLRTYHFTTGTPSYVEKASNRFHFGKTLPVSSSELANRIQTLIPRGRKVVFVGHGVMNDLRALKALGFQFPTRLSTALDTSQIAHEVLGSWTGSLRELLKELKCPYNGLHCAGNDANFTLKALLLLVAKGLEEQNSNKRMVKALRRIGQQEIPHHMDPKGKTTVTPGLKRKKSRE
jgi:DNA polymerase III epsilon subunit-like protein